MAVVANRANSFTLHIMIMGFFALIPQTDSITVLAPDLSDKSFASDGTVIPEHRALLAYRCQNLPNHSCTAIDRSSPALMDLVKIDRSDPTLGVRQLNKVQISVKGKVATKTPPVPASLPPGIALMDKIDSSASQVDKTLLLNPIPVGSRDLITARLSLTNITFRKPNFIQENAGFDTVFDFGLLRNGVLPNDYQTTLADQLDISMEIDDCSVEVQLDGFDGTKVGSVALAQIDCSNPSEIVDVMLYNQTICSHSISTTACDESLKAAHYGIHHFEAYYELSNQRPPIRRRRVPLFFNCGTTSCPDVNPFADGVSRPICPTVAMKP